jgi:putative ABC transport system permease protein
MGLAVLIAFPSAVYIYQILPGAYKFELGLWEFILAFAIVAGVSVLTIVYHVLRAATRNPVEALRYE